MDSFQHEDTHPIDTQTGDGPDSTNQQPNIAAEERASPSSNRYLFYEHTKTPMLCTNYNGELKLGRQSKLRPLKKEITIDKNTAKTLPSTLYQNFTPKWAELKLTQL